MIRRVTAWVLCLVLAIGVFYGPSVYNYIVDKNNSKTPILIYAPDDMIKPFVRAYKMADFKFKSSHKIIQTSDKKAANIVVETGKEYDAEYEKLAFSPFVIAYAYNENNLKRFKQTGLLIESSYNKENFEIDFIKVINEVLGEGNWEKFGIKNEKKINIFYPDTTTKYWSDFYDFMLVTVNNGSYPKDDAEMQNAVKQVESFINSQYTESVKDFGEKNDRVGGFVNNTLWIIPEKLAIDLSYNHDGSDAEIFYPTTTVYMNYYVKYDEVGSKLKEYYDKDGFIRGSFYDLLCSKSKYRNAKKSEITSDYAYSERNEFNALVLEKNRIKPT